MSRVLQCDSATGNITFRNTKTVLYLVVMRLTKEMIYIRRHAAQAKERLS